MERGRPMVEAVVAAAKRERKKREGEEREGAEKLLEEQEQRK